MNFPDMRTTAEPADEPPADTRSCDAFFGGRFELFQPRRRGFRSGLDALLLAATLRPDWDGRCADLGAGAGTVGFAAACRARKASFVLVEKDADAVAMMRDSLELKANETVRDRLQVVEADLIGDRRCRLAAGLADNGFDAILTNPPFYPHGFRASPDARRAAALTASEPDFLFRWFKSAAALLRHGGFLSTIVRPDSLPILIEISRNRFGAMRVLPVHTRARAPATRLLIGARKGSRAPLALLPGLELYGEEGQPTALLTDISHGVADLGDVLSLS